MNKKDKVDPFEAFAIDVFGNAWKKGVDRAKEFEIVAFETLDESLVIRVEDKSNCSFRGLKDGLCSLAMCDCHGANSKYCLLNCYKSVVVEKLNKL